MNKIKIVLAIAALAIGAMGANAQRIALPFSEVYSPLIPPSVNICGQTVHLDRTDMYERFDRELTAITYTHGTTLLILKRANRYFPEMAPILRANGVPQDLLYLAVVESSLNPRALSPASAAGFWQFIPATAREYGLEVNDEVDERYNLEKATAAACRYLKSSYNRFGDWPSVMAAYNGGNARVSRELERQDADTSLDLYLAEETSRYPYRIMAMKTLMENPQAYGYHIADNQLYQPRRYRTVEVSGPVDDWAAWAIANGTTYLTLREENPWIRDRKLTNRNRKTYTVKIPTGESMSRSRAGSTTYNDAWTDR